MANVRVERNMRDDTLIVYLENQFGIESVVEAVKLAKEKIAELYWQENADKIMAKMDIKGLANLIAVHASNALKNGA